MGCSPWSHTESDTTERRNGMDLTEAEDIKKRWQEYWSIKLLEENIGKTLSDMHHSRILYDPPPRILEIKAKINKWDLIKLKSFCTSKETISKARR